MWTLSENKPDFCKVKSSGAQGEFKQWNSKYTKVIGGRVRQFGTFPPSVASAACCFVIIVDMREAIVARIAEKLPVLRR